MILHVDMDAFYAAIEERDHPPWRGQPLIVSGSTSGRGVVSAANYAARAYGVHSAMPARQAKALCPKGVFVAPRHAVYAQVSQQIHDIFRRYTPVIEPLALDEAFLDVTHSQELFGSAEHIGRLIKQDIRHELDLVASVGVASNKFLAKIASDIQKPDGFVVVAPEQAQRFLDPLPIARLWGVGPRGARQLQGLGVKTIADVRDLSAGVLQQHFGKWGQRLYQLARAIDPRPVVPGQRAKSISHETTFASDIGEEAILHASLLELTQHVAARLRLHELLAEVVVLKLRFADFRTITRQLSLPRATNITQELWQVAKRLLRQHLPASHSGIRLLGVGAAQLVSQTQIASELFEDQLRQQQRQLDAVSDAINQRYGAVALQRAGALKRP